MCLTQITQAVLILCPWRILGCSQEKQKDCWAWVLRHCLSCGACCKSKQTRVPTEGRVPWKIWRFTGALPMYANNQLRQSLQQGLQRPGVFLPQRSPNIEMCRGRWEGWCSSQMSPVPQVMLYALSLGKIVCFLSLLFEFFSICHIILTKIMLSVFHIFVREILEEKIEQLPFNLGIQ